MKNVGWLFGRLALAVSLLSIFVFGPTPEAKAANVNQVLSAASTATALVAYEGEQVYYEARGAFTGTLSLEKSLGGLDFQVITSTSNNPAASVFKGTYTVTDARVALRWNMSSYTTGKATVTLEDLSDSVRSWQNKKGEDVLTIKDAGVFAPFPPIETLVAGGTITANACGGIKRVRSQTAWTSGRSVFTVPYNGIEGCPMTVLNAGPADLTLGYTTDVFVASAAVNVILKSSDSINVANSGAGGYWFLTSPPARNRAISSYP